MNPLAIPSFVARGILTGVAETILAAADTIELWRAFKGR